MEAVLCGYYVKSARGFQYIRAVFGNVNADDYWQEKPCPSDFEDEPFSHSLLLLNFTVVDTSRRSGGLSRVAIRVYSSRGESLANSRRFVVLPTCVRVKTENREENAYAIKNSLAISKRRRPMWDAGFLEGINFSVRLDEDISSAVHRDKRCDYDSEPLFAIHATK